MPKRLSAEQLEALNVNGALAPAEPSAHEPGETFRVLGSTGLPNETHVDPMGQDENSDLGTIHSGQDASQESNNSKSFHAAYLDAYRTTRSIMLLAVESLPKMDATLETERTFELYQTLDLEPDIVITPANRPLIFWERLFEVATKSAWNTKAADATKLNGNGLSVDAHLRDNWMGLVGDDSRFRVDVVSGASIHTAHITSLGYEDTMNTRPSQRINMLLQLLGFSQVPVGNGKTLADKGQLPCLPRVDTYLMQQLSRLQSGKSPVDANTWSWLKGVLPSNTVPDGGWSQNVGIVSLGFATTSYWSDTSGVRPSGRGK